MIISRTPFRVSFLGGGTDLPDFYKQEDGAVTTTTIKQYMYITVHQRFSEGIRVGYSKTEDVKCLDDLKHDRARECLRLLDITDRIEITSIADIPASTGLGSSSSYTVGLLNALHAHLGEHVSPEKLAQEAVKIEIDILRNPIGKQDQYAAAYGGLKHIQFNRDGSVFTDIIVTTEETRRRLNAYCMMFYTGMTRSANEILAYQSKNVRLKMEKLEDSIKLRDLARTGRDCLTKGDVEGFGRLLHEGWMIKQRLAEGITNPKIDKMYQAGREAGAIGGKILGAGGGGFLLLFCEPERQARVRTALEGTRQLEFEMEPQGSKIIHFND